MRGSAGKRKGQKGHPCAQTIFSLLCSAFASSAPDVILLRFTPGDGESTRARSGVKTEKSVHAMALFGQQAHQPRSAFTVSLFIVLQVAACNVGASGWWKRKRAPEARAGHRAPRRRDSADGPHPRWAKRMPEAQQRVHTVCIARSGSLLVSGTNWHEHVRFDASRNGWHAKHKLRTWGSPSRYRRIQRINRLLPDHAGVPAA